MNLINRLHVCWNRPMWNPWKIIVNLPTRFTWISISRFVVSAPIDTLLDFCQTTHLLNKIHIPRARQLRCIFISWLYTEANGTLTKQLQTDDPTNSFANCYTCIQYILLEAKSFQTKVIFSCPFCDEERRNFVRHLAQLRSLIALQSSAIYMTENY